MTYLKNVLEIKNLSLSFKVGGGILSKYANLHALSNIELNVPRGKTLALVGESGCGKTCLLYTSPSPRD